MAFTSVFGGTTVYPSDVSLISLNLTADVALEWPLENAGGTPAARVIETTLATAAYAITMPDARRTGAGQCILFNNLSASSYSLTVKDNAGNALAVIAPGEQWQLILSGTGTAAGTWRAFRFGASTATVQASALAGLGLASASNQLQQATPVQTFNSSPRAVTTNDRAALLVWTASGSATVTLPSVASAGNNFFISIRNSGGGTVTIDPAGSETIDDAATLVLRPGDSATVVCDGLEWYTLGLGQQAVFAFDYTSISLTGVSGNYTLAGAELNRVAYKFTGTLTANVVIIVPPTIQQYWLDNATSGAFTVQVKTASGSPIGIPQGQRSIYYCDGTNVVNAATAGLSSPLAVADGGTGITSYAIGDLLYASGTTALSKLASIATGNVLLSGGVGTAPSWGKVGLTTHVSGSLPLANGGTGGTDAATARTNLGLGTMATQAANSVAITGGAISGITDLAVADGGTGASDAATARTNLGGTTVGSNLFTLANPSAVRFLRLNADNTVSALDDAGFRTAIGVGTGTGTVTSVALSGGTTGLTTSGGPITNSGTITIAGTLVVANGGTGSATAAGARSNLGAAASGANTDITSLRQSVSVAASGTIAADSLGYRGLPQNSQSSGYTLVLADAGKHVSISTGGITIPANSGTAFPIGTAISIYNNSASTQTIAITTDTLWQAGTTNTGARTLAARGLATLLKVNTTEWVVSGNVT